ncbi:MAG: hypothetical protein MR993_02295, partial [Spirochaetes bacterium]|nr:hypothetical protein [Spirochaetota bacterium]
YTGHHLESSFYDEDFLFYTDFWLFNRHPEKGRFLRIFAVFCSFFGNILAMTRGFCSLFWGNTNIFSPV